MNEPIWIDKPEVLIVHSMQLAEHGGSAGIRDETLLDSPLTKPRDVFTYSNSVSLPRLAASYAFGLARKHAFIDGNKRTALVVSEGFLRVNGFKVVSAPEEKYFTFLHLADGSLTEEELTAWFTKCAVPL